MGQGIKVIPDEDLIVVRRDGGKGKDAYEFKNAQWTGQYKNEKDLYVGDLVAVKWRSRKGKKIAIEVMGLSRVSR